MKIGVFSVLFKDMEFAQAMEHIEGFGAEAVEIGTGGYPGSEHCRLDELLTSSDKRKSYLETAAGNGLMISAFSCHYEPLHPNQALAKESNEVFRKTVKLARLMEVPVVNAFSGIPGGAPGDRMPNWVTCPWPPHNLEILEYQWREVAIPYWREAAKFAEDHGVDVAIEMHPGMLIYNVESMLRMREEVGPSLGCNFDPSHLFWNNANPVAAIHALGDAIFHVHGKDCYVNNLNTAVNGCIDNKPYRELRDRSWIFRTIGYGHDIKIWKDIVSALRLSGYDYVISIEHEDPLMSSDEGLRKGVEALKDAVISSSHEELFQP